MDSGHTVCNELDNCSFCKTLLMLLVMMYHSCVFWTGNWWDTPPILPSLSLKALATWLNSFHIYGFVLISGYLFAFKVRGGGYPDYSAFLKNKAKRLLIPYLFVAAVWLIPISIAMYGPDWNRLIDNYVLCKSPEQLWFLWMLFWVFALVWPVRNTVMAHPALGWAFALALYLVGIMGQRYLPNVFQIWTACQCMLFFLIGMRLRTSEEQGGKTITQMLPWYLWVAMDVLLFVLLHFTSRRTGALWSVANHGFGIALHFVGALMAWTTFQTLASHARWRNSRWFKRLASYSMPMYLFHQQFIYFTILKIDGRVTPWLHAGINFATALAGAYLISTLLMKQRVTRFLIGEK